MDTSNTASIASEPLLADLKEQLYSLTARDPALFSGVFSEALRLSIIVKTGNVQAWKQWKKDQEENMDRFFREAEDAKKLHSLAERLQ